MPVLAIDWDALLLPHTPLLELIVRGTLTYVVLLVLLRLVLKRQMGGIGVPDLLVIVLIAHGAHNALVGEYRSLADGLVIVVTILAWSHALNWLGYNVPFVGRLVHPAPLELVRDGRENWRNLRREFISQEELLTHIRRAGAEDVSDVKAAMMEGNGEISVITFRPDEERPAASRKVL